MGAEDKTTVQISLALDERIKKLAAQRATKLGISSPLSKGTYLEVLITEEEERLKNENND
jgi:hypothetical protein